MSASQCPPDVTMQPHLSLDGIPTLTFSQGSFSLDTESLDTESEKVIARWLELADTALAKQRYRRHKPEASVRIGPAVSASVA